MSTYAELAPYFDAIFQLSESERAFYDRLAIGEGDRVLEIGCGTGELVRFLSRYGATVAGMDLDETMVAVAQAKGIENDRVRFLVGDMAGIGRLFAPASFTHILCVGNTLVHLPSRESIAAFLGEAAGLLAAGGTLVLQVLNYGKILRERIDRLPLIENDQVRFERRYAPVPGTPLLRFERSLTVRDTGQRYESTVDLYPLAMDELRQIVAPLFAGVHWYGSFGGDHWSAESDLVVARLVR